MFILLLTYVKPLEEVDALMRKVPKGSVNNNIDNTGDSLISSGPLLSKNGLIPA